MRHWEEVRGKARAWHASAAAAAHGDPSAAGLLAAAERLTGVARVPVPAGDSLLDGADALLDTAAGLVVFARDVEPWRALFVQAHEYAHLWLDGGRACCAGPDIDAAADEGLPLFGAERVEGYGPRERREREANLFALEFLLPCPLLRRWYRDEGLDAVAIAVRTGLPTTLVCAQLSHALLLPGIDEETGDPSPAGSVIELDPSQRAAAHAPRGPLLVEAGPGTGKTRTLVARVLFLLQRGVAPSAILALTFSQRAAEEMRGRVSAVAPQAASSLWMGTFHAFGLELLRKFGTRLGLPPAPAVLDPLDALFWLERRLPALQLEHYQNLYEPARPLRDILAAISRAKDELVGPEEYAALAERMRATATTEREREASARALEVARVYAFYQYSLQRDGLLDFGDLIARAVALLRAHPDVRAMVRSAYPQVLVDEYQDVNRASGLLLREIAGGVAPPGAGLWVVGDARQAIYRFRGAAPANMRLFAADFPGATVLALSRNYRSQPPIVAAVAAVAPRMRAAAGAPFTPWEAQRPEAGGAVHLEIAADDAAEIRGLARAIEEQRTQGRAYGDQAVLCRSHLALARVAAGLEAAGVPVLYLGDVFERPEVRDMLALLALAAGDGSALMRVARFAEYAVPLADVQAVLALAHARAVPFPRALAFAADAREAPSLSLRGRVGLSLLARHLDGLAFGTGAWSLLVQYLFARSGYLRSVMGETPAALQKRLALYQFLQFARERHTLPGADVEDPKRTFLRYVRRLESVGEEKGLRQVPGWAGGIDAVRLLTIHASKGLEFGAVYLPMVAQRYIPAPRRRELCPPPPGLRAGGTDDQDEHEEEEECLFFVAVSRARDVLCLSRARRYGRRASKPSRLLALLDGALPGASDGPVTWPAGAPSLREPGVRSGPIAARPAFGVEALELYLRCPRQFYYERVLGLRGWGEDEPYAQLRRCVRTVLAWVQEQEAAGGAVDEAAAQARLAEVWQAEGPHEHVHEALYRQSAAAMVAHALSRFAHAGRPVEASPSWEVELAHGRVTLRPDRLEIVGDGATQAIVVRRLRSSSGDGGERQKRLDALYHAAAARAHPTATRRVQTIALVTARMQAEEEQEVTLDAAAVAAPLAQYDAAIAGIVQQQFGPQPDERRCPRCPYYFICPAGDETRPGEQHNLTL